MFCIVDSSWTNTPEKPHEEGFLFITSLSNYNPVA